MAVLNREQFLNFNDLETVTVSVPGGELLVRTLTGEEKEQFEQLVVKEKPDGTRDVDMTDFRTRLIAQCVVDENGNRMFTLDDVKALNKKSAKTIDALFTAAEKLSGLRKQDEEEALKN